MLVSYLLSIYCITVFTFHLLHFIVFSVFLLLLIIIYNSVYSFYFLSFLFSIRVLCLCFILCLNYGINSFPHKRGDPKSRLTGCALTIYRIKSNSKPRGSSRHLDRVGCTQTATSASCQSEVGLLCETWRTAAFASIDTDVREFTRFRWFPKVSAIDVVAHVDHSRSGINS